MYFCYRGNLVLNNWVPFSKKRYMFSAWFTFKSMHFVNVRETKQITQTGTSNNTNPKKKKVN